MTMDEKRKWLEERGFFVGERDPNRNQAFAGRYMVAEPLEEGEGPVTQDASGGAWCLVGDDLNALIEETFKFFSDDEKIG